MGRLKEAWLSAVENGAEEEFLNSFPELTREDKEQFKSLMGAETEILDALMFDDDLAEEDFDGEFEGLPNQGS